MEDQLNEFEAPKREPAKTRRVIGLYIILITFLIAAIVRAYSLGEKITHH